MKQWQSLMAAEEKRTGLPAGVLASLVQQETGGQQRFIDNPGDFHYKAGPNGEKPKSTARGLGGILESTAKDPGYGVAPLKNWSVPEQLRFMADYTQARSKQAGSLQGGLAGYGEGSKYSQQVMARLNTPAASPLALPDEQFNQLAAQPQAVIAQAPVPVSAPTAPMPQAPLPEAPFVPMQMAQAAPHMQAFDNAMPAQIKPNLGNSVPKIGNVPINFNRFKSLIGRA